VKLLIVGHEQMDRYGLYIWHPLVLCKECLEIDLLKGIKNNILFLYYSHKNIGGAWEIGIMKKDLREYFNL
jgi:hypothetical protein